MQRHPQMRASLALAIVQGETEMTAKIGINGFGRMGRLGLRAGWGRDEFDFVRINEIATDAVGSAHLLKFDSVHGVWGHETDADDASMIIDGKPMTAYCRSFMSVIHSETSAATISEIFFVATSPTGISSVGLI